MNNSLHSSNFHSSLFECTLHMIKNKIAHYMNYERGRAHAQQRFDAVEPLRTRVQVFYTARSPCEYHPPPEV